MSARGGATARLGRLRQALVGLRPDVTPPRVSRDYRLLHAASAISLFGSMVTAVAAPFQVGEPTGSPLAVGLIGIVELVPRSCPPWSGSRSPTCTIDDASSC